MLDNFMSQIMLVALLYLFIQLHPGKCVSSASLTSIPSSFSSSSTCRPVQMTCRTYQLSSLAWFSDDIEIVSYDYRKTDQFPMTLLTDESGVTIVAVNANSGQNGIFDATSVLTATTHALAMLNVSRITCGTIHNRSQVINVGTLLTQALSPTIPPPTFDCSLSASSGDVVASIMWSPSYTSQHAVERYRISVSPDPSNCSSDHVSPVKQYMCSGIDTTRFYNFTFSAITGCGYHSQEGDSRSFVIQPRQVSVTPEDFTVQPVYNDKAQLIEITVWWLKQDGACGINYTMVLSDSNGIVVERKVVGYVSFLNGYSYPTRFIANSFDAGLKYRVSVSVDDGIGVNNSVTSQEINGSISSLFSLTFENSRSYVTATCKSPESEGYCTIRYSQYYYYQDSTIPAVFGVLNSPIRISHSQVEPSAEYFYQANVNINKSITFVVRGKFTGQYESIWEAIAGHQTVVIFGVMNAVTSILIMISGYLALSNLDKVTTCQSVHSLINLCLLFLGWVLWIPLILNDADSGDTSRSLIISALIASSVALSSVLVLFIMLCSRRCTRRRLCCNTKKDSDVRRSVGSAPRRHGFSRMVDLQRLEQTL